MNLIKNKLFISALAVLLPMFSLAASISPIDSRLVGTWERQRAKEGKCTFMVWKMNRTADGKFTINFFGDAEKKQALGEEAGRWEAAKGKMSMFTDGVPSPDIYTYTFTGKNSAKFTLIERDPSGDCQADYEFTEYRVTK